MTGNKTLMIVDDSKVSRMMISAIVKEKYPNIDFIEASNGDEAIELSKDKDIHYFSIDLNMPGIDGLELIGKLKPDHTNSKYALLTANIQEATHKKADEIGAKCINKPISEDSIGKMMEHFNV